MLPTRRTHCQAVCGARDDTVVILSATEKFVMTTKSAQHRSAYLPLDDPIIWTIIPSSGRQCAPR